MLTAPDATQIISEELVEGSEYEFRVIACNKVGQSEPSPPSRMIVAKNPYGMFPGNLFLTIEIKFFI